MAINASPPTTIAPISAPVKAKLPLPEELEPVPVDPAPPAVCTVVVGVVAEFGIMTVPATVSACPEGPVPTPLLLLFPKTAAMGVPPLTAICGSVQCTETVTVPSGPVVVVASWVPLTTKETDVDGLNPVYVIETVAPTAQVTVGPVGGGGYATAAKAEAEDSDNVKAAATPTARTLSLRI